MTTWSYAALKSTKNAAYLPCRAKVSAVNCAIAAMCSCVLRNLRKSACIRVRFASIHAVNRNPAYTANNGRNRHGSEAGWVAFRYSTVDDHVCVARTSLSTESDSGEGSRSYASVDCFRSSTPVATASVRYIFILA